MDILGFVQSYLIVVIIVSLVLAVLQIAALWRIFVKAGQAGWKAIIPFYNAYILFKISWSPMWFWITFMCSFVAAALLSFVTVTACMVIGIIIEIIVFIISLVMLYKLCKSFGWGVGMFILAIFFHYIMILVLGFGKAQYVGIVNDDKAEEKAGDKAE